MVMVMTYLEYRGGFPARHTMVYDVTKNGFFYNVKGIDWVTRKIPGTGVKAPTNSLQTRMSAQLRFSNCRLL
jgi:hypothetical protein